jgi:DNA-binding CsgD family transcriptional regulator
MFGREREFRRVVELIDGADRSSQVVVVDGPAGIGKSSLLEAAIVHASARGCCVVKAKPTAAEATLGFAVLSDLLRRADLAGLEEARRQVLEIALGRRRPVGEPPTVVELGGALLALLDARTADQTLVVVIDDLQWVDVATRELLTFVMRRLPAERVCVLCSQRTSDDQSVELPEALRMPLGVLERAAIEEVVRASLTTATPGHVVDRLVAAAHGNPLFAIELARSIADVAVRPGQPLPLPPSLASAITDRLRPLPVPTQEALAAVALLARPTVATLADLEMLEALAPAERAGVIAIEGPVMTFTHPLLASASHDALPGIERLSMHGRLASVTTGTERCIHLALGSTHPDAEVAAALTAAAVDELGRGASTEAADLAVLALQATPADDHDRWGRLLVCADALFRAGRTTEAVTWLREAIDGAPELLRAKALLALATVEYSRSDDTETAAQLARAVLQTTDDLDLLAEAHTILANVVYTDFVEAAEHADAALDIIRRRPNVEPVMLGQAIHAAASARFRAGEGLDRAAFERAIELERGSTVPIADSAFGVLAALLKYADELDEARTMFESLTERADAGSLPYALGHLPQLHIWSGRWDDAERCARRHLDHAERAGQDAQSHLAQFNLALVAAYRGHVAKAEEIGRALFDEGRELNVPWTERNGAGLLGFVAMTTNDPVRAVELFSRYDELGESMRLREPGYHRFQADYVEALVATGDIARATEVVDRLDARATRLGRISALAAARRGRSLVAAHSGDRERAFANARAAHGILDGTPLVYERARALLTLGVVARRFKERGAARRALTESLEQFNRMGAASLAERVRRELDRIDGRAASAAGDRSSLTATETRVAERAAAGDTTRQIADALFISAKTVEANLTRIYRKLGVVNRAQLAARMSEERES